MTGEAMLVLLALKIYLVGLWFSIFFFMGEESINSIENDSALIFFLIKILFWFITIPYKCGKLFYRLNKSLET